MKARQYLLSIKLALIDKTKNIGDLLTNGSKKFKSNIKKGDSCVTSCTGSN